MSARAALVWAALAGLANAACLSSPSSGDDDDAPVDACGTTRGLREDFEQESLDTATWNAARGTIVSGAGQLWATPDTSAFLETWASYLVADSDLEVELGLGNLAPESVFTMALNGRDEDLAMRLDGTSLQLTVVEAGVPRVPASVTYDPSQDWWRLREADGTVHAETSADGVEWTEIGAVEWSEPMALVRFELEGFSSESTVDVLSINPMSDELACPTSSLTESYDDLDQWWEIADGDCTITSNGELSLRYGAETTCVIMSRRAFDLRDSSISIELVDAGGDCAPSPSMTLFNRDVFVGVACRSDLAGPGVIAFTSLGEGGPLPYVPEDHRYLRLTHDPGQGGIVYATSATGEDDDWHQFDLMEIDDTDLGELQVSLYIEGPVTGDPLDGVSFDNINR